MRCYLNPPLTAKNGHAIEALVVCRVSDPGPGKQDIRSLDDQESMHLEWLKSLTDMPVNVTVIAGSGSGELLGRREYLELWDEVESAKYDVVCCEDVGRIARRVHAHLFAEHCVDYNTRLLSKNDGADTAIDGWEDRTILAAWHHERSNRDNSARIKRGLNGKFNVGGALPVLIPGIIKPPGAKSDTDLYKDSYWEPIYDAWFKRLDSGQDFSEIADWLNKIGAPTGCKKPKYDCALVGQRSRNTILKGVRQKNRRTSRRINKTGKRQSIKARPEDLLERVCPNLVFIEAKRYDRIIADVNSRNARYRRRGLDGVDTRKNISRKRTRFPGQCLYCGICGELYVLGGNGRTDHLICRGTRAHTCWCGTTVDGPLAAAKIADAIAREIESLNQFNPLFVQMVNEETQKLSIELDENVKRLTDELKTVQVQIDNYVEEVGSGNHSDAIKTRLRHLEIVERPRIQRELAETERKRPRTIVLPSPAELKQIYSEMFCDLAIDSFEFARRLRQLVPRIVVFPFQLIDGGHVVMRAKFQLRLAALISDPGMQTVLSETLNRVLEVDLFQSPQREMFRQQVVALRASGMTPREVADKLGLTLPAVHRASKLQRQMDKLAIRDPYRSVTEPITNGKRKRHLNRRYEPKRRDDTGQL